MYLITELFHFTPAGRITVVKNDKCRVSSDQEMPWNFFLRQENQRERQQIRHDREFSFTSDFCVREIEKHGFVGISADVLKIFKGEVKVSRTSLGTMYFALIYYILCIPKT